MLDILLTLIRRHILITLLLPLSVALTGAALHRRDLDPDYAVTKVAALMRTTSANDGQGVQSFGQIAAGLATAIRTVTP